MPNNKNKCCLLMLCCLIGTQVSAKIIPWKEQIPSSLSVFQGKAQVLADLTANSILIYVHPAQSITLPTLKNQQSMIGKFYTGAVVVPTNSQNVARLLSNYSQYNGLFPVLKSAKVLEQQGNITQMKYQVSIPTPIPVLNFKENMVMQHHLTANSISTIVLDAPIPYGAGKIEWFDLGSNKTLITITQWGDLNHPKGFLFSTILNAIPEAKLGIPSSTNAFLLKALQQRFKTTTAQTLKVGELPDLQLDTAQVQKIAALSQFSQERFLLSCPLTKCPISMDWKACALAAVINILPKARNSYSIGSMLHPFKNFFHARLKTSTSKKWTPTPLMQTIKFQSA